MRSTTFRPARYQSFWNALSIAVACCPVLARSQDSAIIPIIEDQILGASQSADERVTYVFEAAQGETYLVEIDQQGLDFIIEVTDPNGADRFYNSPLQRYEREFVLFENTVPGVYQISVASNEPTDSPGVHSIRISKIGGQTDLGATAMGAWRLMTEGAQADRDGKRSNPQEALGKYQAAASLWQQLGRTRLRAEAIFCMARIEFAELYDWSSAASLSQEAAMLYQSLNQPQLAAVATATAARSLMELGNQQDVREADATFDRAIGLYDEAHAIFEQLGNVYELAVLLTNKGVTYFYKGDFEQAVSLWREATPMFASLGEWMEEANTSQNIAVVEVQQGYNASAIEVFRGILQRLPVGREEGFRATVFDNLAQAQRSFGDADEALQASSAALDIHRQLADRRGQTFSLLSIGRTYFGFGEFDLARDYLQQALPMAQQTNDGRSRAMILTTLGSMSFIEADYESAADYHQDAVESSVSMPDRAYREILLARDLTALGRYQTAIETLNGALATARQENALVTEADAMQELGLSYVASGAAERGHQSLLDALMIYESLRLENEQAITLDGLAASSRAMGNFDAAVTYGNRSLELLEILRESVATPELRAFYTAVRRRPYENQVNLLMDRHWASGTRNDEYVRAALTVSERARARMMMDLIAEASIQLASNLDEQTLAHQAELYRELSAKQIQRDGLLEHPISSARDQKLLDDLLQDLTTIETELDVLDANSRRSRPELRSLDSSETLTASAIQAGLDPDSVLIQYMLGDEQSYAWLITKDSIRAVELVSRRVIEDAAREAYGRLELFAADESGQRSRDEALRSLADFVLAPVAELLVGRQKRMLISPDGALDYIPFGILPIELDGTSARLMERYEIINLPSMSVYLAQKARKSAEHPTKQLAIFADPVYESSDPRLGDLRFTKASAEYGPADFRTRSSVDANLVRLVSTGREASAISTMVPAEARLLATGFSASRDSVVNSDLSQFRYLHFATHGLVDSRHPALSALALSMFEEDGGPLDGYLRLPDIYALKLNADLVVLSACETALGRDIRGEGLVGLTQGFMYAGAKSLVVSLWQVPDAATAVLMTRFYEHLFEDDASPAEALRLAQLSVASERRWRDPYFWAGFIAVGSP